MVIRARKVPGRPTRAGRMLARCCGFDGKLDPLLSYTAVNSALRNKFTRNQLFRWARGQKGGAPTADQMDVIYLVTKQLSPDGPIEHRDWASDRVRQWGLKGDVSAPLSPMLRELVQGRPPRGRMLDAVGT